MLQVKTGQKRRVLYLHIPDRQDAYIPNFQDDVSTDNFPKFPARLDPRHVEFVQLGESSHISVSFVTRAKDLQLLKLEI